MTDRRRSEDWQTPGLGLLCKLGSIARHAEEAITLGGHPLDAWVIESLLNDPEVRAWMREAT